MSGWSQRSPPRRPCYITVASPWSSLPARQVKLDSEVSSVFVSGWGEGGLVLLWRVSSGGFDHSELPEELSHPKATWIS